MVPHLSRHGAGVLARVALLWADAPV